MVMIYIIIISLLKSISMYILYFGISSIVRATKKQYNRIFIPFVVNFIPF